MVGEKALASGMIDGIASKTSPTEVTSSMDLAELKAKHSEVFMAAFAEGKTAGTEEERERVKAHAVMAEAAKAPELGLKHIADGSIFGPAIQAEYAAAHMKASDTAARAGDDKDAPSGGDPKPDDADGKAKDSVFDAAFQIIFAGHGLDANGNKISARA